MFTVGTDHPIIYSNDIDYLESLISEYWIYIYMLIYADYTCAWMYLRTYIMYRWIILYIDSAKYIFLEGAASVLAHRNSTGMPLGTGMMPEMPELPQSPRVAG